MDITSLGRVVGRVAMAAGFALALNACSLAVEDPPRAMYGPVGISRNFKTADPDSATIAELQSAAQQALQEARTGNKNNLEFRRKNYEINQVIAKIKSGQTVDQAEIDESLAPVHVW